MATTAEMSIPVRQLFIDGEWTEPATGKYFSTVNPATEEVIAQVAQAGPEDVDRAVTAARKAFQAGPWPAMSPKERARILWKIGELIFQRVDELARLETMDNGKPIFESRYADIPMVADVFQYYAGWATKIHGETVPIGMKSFNFTYREPVGVVAAIVPWNFPLLLASWKIAPALAAGNTVIVKPASLTPLTALKLAEIAQEAGVPPGVLNVIPGPGNAIGTALVTHSGVDKIAFTGETRTGKEILRGGADTLKKVTLELGGKSPNIVFADANLDAAVKGASIGIFYGKGEVCAAGSRLLVHKSIHDALMEQLTARTRKLAPDDPMNIKTRLGAIVSQSQLDKVLSYIEAGKKEGAQLVAGGQRAQIGSGKGYFIQPTIFDGVKNEMTIAREEIFGPVLATIVFQEEEEAIAYANDTQYGLAAAVWTRDIGKAHRVARQIQTGTVWINTYNQYDSASSFGGYKASGFGRELGVHGLDAYTQVKTIWVDLGA
ncbi:MAG TPA: betaine-aldehyde dehydrogenase [Acidobacteriota bacterium]|nr:betaine-aldehyde dehydrogenase [Acidobacteriota bacterium]